MVLRNIVILQDGKPAIMHFYSHSIQRRDIPDSLTGQVKPKNALVLDVDWLNGQATSAEFSTLAEKLASQLEPYLEGKAYQKYQFIITKRGSGFATEFEVQTSPWTGPLTPPG